MKKIVVFGYSKTGKEIAKLLKDRGYEVAVFDENPLHVREANLDGFVAECKTLMDDKDLIKIGITTDVEAFFCVGSDDSTNLFITLSARNLNKKLKILTITKSKEDEKKMLLAGANRTINPYAVGALKAFRLIEKPKILNVIDELLFFSNELEISEIEVPKGSFLDGKYFKELDMLKKYNLVFLGILDKELGEEFIFFLKGINHMIDYKDIVVLIGYNDEIKRFRDDLLSGIK